jgi:integrase
MKSLNIDDLNLKSGDFVSRSGYVNNEFNMIWRLSRDIKLDFCWIDDFLSENLASSFIRLLRHYAIKSSAAHASKVNVSFKRFFKFVIEVFGGEINKIRVQHVITYKSSFLKKDLYNVGVLKGFLKVWNKLQLFGVSDEIIELLNEWKFQGNTTGEAVRTRNPIQGALTENELQAFFEGINQAFVSQKISLFEYAFARLCIATGRRPSQIGDLKACDLISAKADSDATIQYILNVPRRKQRAIKWRGEFRGFALTFEMGSIVQTLINENERRMQKLDCNITGISDLIPVFTEWGKINNRLNVDRDIFETEFYHCNTSKLSNMLAKVAASINVHSERTGKTLVVRPIRLRRTKGTAAAREGYGVLTIAEILDHSGIGYAHVYVENVPEFVHKLNKAMAHQLAPFAQAFSGKLVRDRSEALRGEQPESTVRDEYGAVGTCGNYGFCGALGPIACYTCSSFQPWLDAPHQDLLDRLIEDRERIKHQTGDDRIAAINDRSIYAVAEVIRLCEERKRSVGSLIFHG